jgi:hypothetical protein
MNYSHVGLILDMIGVLILFKFGLPSSFKDGTEQFKFPDNPQRDNYNRGVKFMARLGLLFLLLGFIFQYIGSNPPTICSCK